MNNEHNFEVKIRQGNNLINQSNNNSVLNLIKNYSTDNSYLNEINLKQYISYQMIKIVSQNYNYMDISIYNYINTYINSIDINYIKGEIGDFLKINLTLEIYKLTELMKYYSGKIIDPNILIKELNDVICEIFNSK